MTKEEIESGWNSADLVNLSWSFYLLIVSILFVLANIFLIYAAVRVRRPLGESKNDASSDLIFADLDTNGILNAYAINEYQQMTDTNVNIDHKNSKSNQKPIRYFDSSSKLKRIIDTIY